MGVFLDVDTWEMDSSPKSAQRSPESCPGTPRATIMKPKNTNMITQGPHNGCKMNATDRTTKKKHLKFKGSTSCRERHGGDSSRSEYLSLSLSLYIYIYIYNLSLSLCIYIYIYICIIVQLSRPVLGGVVGLGCGAAGPGRWHYVQSVDNRVMKNVNWCDDVS